MATAKHQNRSRIKTLLLCLVVSSLSLILTAEVAFRIAGAFVGGRENQVPTDGDRFRIMVIGDSHAYGAMIPEKEAFPAHLQAKLEAAQPGKYSVFNLGVPGTNTAQALTRLPTLIDTYHPQMVILWGGVNNAWNRTGNLSRTDQLRNLGDRIASQSKVYRFVRVLLHHRSLDQSVAAEERGLGRRQPQKFDFEKRIWTIKHPSYKEEVRGTGRNMRSVEEMEEQTYQDVIAMRAWLHALGIEFVLVTYPSPESAFGAANRGIVKAGTETGTPIILWPELPEFNDENGFEWLSGAHPNGPLYEVIAERAYEAILALHVERNAGVSSPGADDASNAPN